MGVMKTFRFHTDYCSVLYHFCTNDKLSMSSRGNMIPEPDNVLNVGMFENW